MTAPKASPLLPDIETLPRVCICGASLCKLAASKTIAFCMVCERTYLLPDYKLVES